MAMLIIKYFLQTALTTEAPRNEMGFWQNLKKYQNVDKEKSHNVEKSIFRQIFCLTEELVVLALCHKQTSDWEKVDIAKALLEADRSQSFLPMKLWFKVNLLHGKPHDLPKLAEFVGARTWLIFDLLDIDLKWRSTDFNTLMENQEYIRFLNIANSIVCVNECAERCVHNACQYAEYSKDPEQRYQAVFIVNQQRELADFHRLTKKNCAKCKKTLHCSHCTDPNVSHWSKFCSALSLCE